MRPGSRRKQCILMGVYSTMSDELQSFCAGKHKNNSRGHGIPLSFLYMFVPLTRRPIVGEILFLHLDECKSDRTSRGCWVCFGVEVAEMDMICFRAISQSLGHFPSAGLFFWSLFSVSFSILTTRWYSNPQCSNCFYTMYWTLWIRKYNDRFLIHVSQIWGMAERVS